MSSYREGALATQLDLGKVNVHCLVERSSEKSRWDYSLASQPLGLLPAKSLIITPSRPVAMYVEKLLHDGEKRCCI